MHVSRDQCTARARMEASVGLFEGALHLTGTRGPDRLDLNYQASPDALRRGSAYRALLDAHGIPRSALRPDLVLRHHSNLDATWLFIEAKGGRRPIADSARAATLDLF